MLAVSQSSTSLLLTRRSNQWRRTTTHGARIAASACPKGPGEEFAVSDAAPGIRLSLVTGQPYGGSSLVDLDRDHWRGDEGAAVTVVECLLTHIHPRAGMCGTASGSVDSNDVSRVRLEVIGTEAFVRPLQPFATGVGARPHVCFDAHGAYTSVHGVGPRLAGS